MKNLIALIRDFFYKDFWTKSVLIAIPVILSFFKWEGWPFLVLFLYVVGYVLINIFTTAKKKEL